MGPKFISFDFFLVFTVLLKALIYKNFGSLSMEYRYFQVTCLFSFAKFSRPKANVVSLKNLWGCLIFLSSISFKRQMNVKIQIFTKSVFNSEWTLPEWYTYLKAMVISLGNNFEHNY